MDTSAPQSFTITVNAVNDAPSRSPRASDQAVNEDAGAQTVAGWATAIIAGPANESGQIVDFLVSNDNNGLFSGQPAIAADGTLTYTAAANANGSATVTVQLHDNGGTANGGADTRAPQSFTITVNAVNDAPSFIAGPDQAVNEDAGAQTVAGWATAITRGAGRTSRARSLDFLVSNDNNGLFSGQPAIAADGTLTYTAAANANGSATVTRAAPRQRRHRPTAAWIPAPPQTFTITVNAVNDAPWFTKGVDQVVNEDAGAQTVAGWATAISAGPANESSQIAELPRDQRQQRPVLRASPAIAADGTLTYTAGGKRQWQRHGDRAAPRRRRDRQRRRGHQCPSDLHDHRQRRSTTRRASPRALDQAVNEDAGAQTVAGWATAITAGPANESGQIVDFLVSNDNNGLFSGQPAIAADGTLTYTAAANANGSATVTVRLHDDGGIGQRGVDTSALQSFTITVSRSE